MSGLWRSARVSVAAGVVPAQNAARPPGPVGTVGRPTSAGRRAQFSVIFFAGPPSAAYAAEATVTALAAAAADRRGGGGRQLCPRRGGDDRSTGRVGVGGRLSADAGYDAGGGPRRGRWESVCRCVPRWGLTPVPAGWWHSWRGKGWRGDGVTLGQVENPGRPSPPTPQLRPPVDVHHPTRACVCARNEHMHLCPTLSNL